MAYAKNVGILLKTVRNLGKDGVAIGIAAELEDMGRVLDDVDVNIASFKRIDASTSVNGVLVLRDLNGKITLVRAHLIAPQVVKVQPVGLARFPGDDTHSFDIRTGKDVSLE